MDRCRHATRQPHATRRSVQVGMDFVDPRGFCAWGDAVPFALTSLPIGWTSKQIMHIWFCFNSCVSTLVVATFVCQLWLWWCCWLWWWLCCITDLDWWHVWFPAQISTCGAKFASLCVCVCVRVALDGRGTHSIGRNVRAPIDVGVNLCECVCVCLYMCACVCVWCPRPGLSRGAQPLSRLSNCPAALFMRYAGLSFCCFFICVFIMLQNSFGWSCSCISVLEINFPEFFWSSLLAHFVFAMFFTSVFWSNCLCTHCLHSVVSKVLLVHVFLQSSFGWSCLRNSCVFFLFVWLIFFLCQTVEWLKWCWSSQSFLIQICFGLILLEHFFFSEFFWLILLVHVSFGDIFCRVLLVELACACCFCNVFFLCQTVEWFSNRSFLIQICFCCTLFWLYFLVVWRVYFCLKPSCFQSCCQSCFLNVIRFVIFVTLDVLNGFFAPFGSKICSGVVWDSKLDCFHLNVRVVFCYVFCFYCVDVYGPPSFSFFFRLWCCVLLHNVFSWWSLYNW